MNCIVRTALPILAVLSLTLCTPASAGLVAGPKPAEAPADLSGQAMSGGVAPELLAAAKDLQHAGVHTIILIAAGVTLIIVGIVFLVLYLDDHDVEVHEDDHHHRHDRDRDHDHHGPGSP